MRLPDRTSRWGRDSRTRVVEIEGLRICVRERILIGYRGELYAADLWIDGDDRERAIVDGPSAEQVAALVPEATAAFAACVRLRAAPTPGHAPRRRRRR